jgi:hypothetical protein
MIIPVHNRKAITLKCLETFHNNGDLDKYHVIIAELNYYKAMFGLQGIGLYVYRKIIRFWLFFLFVKITPSSFRQSLKQIK